MPLTGLHPGKFETPEKTMKPFVPNFVEASFDTMEREVAYGDYHLDFEKRNEEMKDYGFSTPKNKQKRRLRRLDSGEVGFASASVCVHGQALPGVPFAYPNRESLKKFNQHIV